MAQRVTRGSVCSRRFGSTVARTEATIVYARVRGIRWRVLCGIRPRCIHDLQFLISSNHEILPASKTTWSLLGGDRVRQKANDGISGGCASAGSARDRHGGDGTDVDGISAVSMSRVPDVCRHQGEKDGGIGGPTAPLVPSAGGDTRRRAG